MFHQDTPHGKVVDVSRRNGGTNPFRRRGDQTVRLMQRHTAIGEFAAPRARLNGLRNAEGCQAQRIEQTAGVGYFTLSQTSPNLLDRYCADPRFHATPTQTGYPRRGRPTSKCVDQDGRIEQQPRHASTRPAIIAAALPPHPLRRVIVPLVTGIIDTTQCRFDLVPTPFIVETTLNEFADESTTSPGACASIEFDDEMVRQSYV